MRIFRRSLLISRVGIENKCKRDSAEIPSVEVDLIHPWTLLRRSSECTAQRTPASTTFERCRGTTPPQVPYGQSSSFIACDGCPAQGALVVAFACTVLAL